MYFLVICSADGAPLPRLPMLSVFDDGAQSLYRDYQRALLEEKRLYWEEIDARKIAEERLREAIDARNELASARERERTLGSRVKNLQEELTRFSDALSTATSRLQYRESWRGWARWPLGRLRHRLQRHLGR